MRVVIHNIPYESNSDTFRLVHLSDTHIGNALCDEKSLEQTVQYIATTPNTYWSCGGDLTDCISRNTGDKRSRESELAPWLHGQDKVFDAQRERTIKLLKPIGGKCLFWNKGNHEDSAMGRLGIDMYWRIIEEVTGEPPERVALGYEGFCKLQFRRGKDDDGNHRGKNLRSVPFTVYSSHGAGGGALAGGKALKLERLIRSYHADILILGHLHALQTLDGTRIEVNNSGRAVERHWHALYGGTYLRSRLENHESYAERAMYPPAPIGSPEIQFTPGSGLIKVSNLFY